MKFDLSKILELYNNSNDRIRYGILGGAVVLVILLDVFLLVLPQMAGIAGVHDQVAKLSDDTQRVLDDKQRINSLKKNLEAQRLQLDALNTKVRPIQEVPALLSTISSIANEYSVNIDQLVPEKNLQESLSETADVQYYALPIVIKAHCGYHMFGHFINKLENENMFFLMKQFIVQNEGNNPNIQSFSLTIKMIVADKK